jgi:hypothetical protein
MRPMTFGFEAVMLSRVARHRNSGRTVIRTRNTTRARGLIKQSKAPEKWKTEEEEEN